MFIDYVFPFQLTAWYKNFGDCMYHHPIVDLSGGYNNLTEKRGITYFSQYQHGGQSADENLRSGHIRITGVL